MKDFPVPVRMIGPGSQDAEGEEFSYLAFPREVPTFSMPQVPANAEAEAIAAAADLLTDFVASMDGPTMPRVDLVGFAPAALEVLNQSLGEGEVSVLISPPSEASVPIRIQETVFAGIWRERHYHPSGEIRHDYLEAAGVPPITIEAAQQAAGATLASSIEIPAGAMNAPALLTEIREQLRLCKPDRPAHVINLTLLPLTPADRALLERVLPPGPVAVLSRGFGNCRIGSTRVRHVWRVQYFNSMQTPILDTLEIVHVPEVALAAPEDLADSRERLADLLVWMKESVAS